VNMSLLSAIQDMSRKVKLNNKRIENIANIQLKLLVALSEGRWDAKLGSNLVDLVRLVVNCSFLPDTELLCHLLTLTHLLL
jgi:hypothetical protein